MMFRVNCFFKACGRFISRVSPLWGLTLLLALFLGKPAAAQDLDWAKSAGGTGFDESNSIVVDGSGNSYVTGYFTGTATFGAGESNETTLTSAGGEDIFVAKYDNSGALLWVKRDGGLFSDEGNSIAVDGSGNSYVTGYFQGSATFGAGESNQTTLTVAGNIDIFVAKYDNSGALLWAKRAGGFFDDAGNDIAVDGSGNSYVTGIIDGFTVTFGAGESNETTLTGANSEDIFVAKYDNSGALLWVKSAGGIFTDIGLGIAVDGSGNSYVSGYHGTSATFGAGESNETTLTPVGNYDIFVAKYDNSGALLWAKRAGGTGSDAGLGLAMDGSGNSYISGFITGSATFGAGESNETTLTSAGNFDIFVAKYDNSGALLWAKSAGGTGNDYGTSIAVNGSGNSYVSGYFLSTAIFGAGESNETGLTSAGNSDIFVAKFSPADAVKPYVLLATESIELDKYKFVEGDMHSNGDIEYDNGRPSTHTGSSSAVGKIIVSRDNTITGPGNLTAGGSIKVDKKAHVDGTVEANAAVDAVDLPSLSYSCSGANGSVKAGKDKEKNVTPGDYNTLSADKNAQLNLSAGEYSVNSLVLNDRSRLYVDVSGGEVIINVCGEINFTKNADIIIVGGTSEDLTINYTGTKVVVLGKDGGYQGNIIAPNAEVELGSKAGFLGSICAKSIVIEKDARVRFHGGAFPKSIGGDDDDEEMISEQPSVISDYVLEQNYPNPFNPTTTISFALPEAGEVTLAIFNTNGQLVKRLVSGEMSAGRHSFTWNATDQRGQRVASGVYLYVLKAGEFVSQRKLVLMK